MSHRSLVVFAGLGLLVLLAMSAACGGTGAVGEAPPAPPPGDTETGPPVIAGVQIFPADNPWNTNISAYPVHPNSAAYLNSIGATGHLHADFGTFWDGHPIGIPFVVVPGTQAKVPMVFEYAAESDPGPYPIPPNPPIEGGPDAEGDRHILVLDKDNQLLYETWDSHPAPGGGWRCGSGAKFDLTSNQLRPEGWTSADAAGLPILPGLVRYDEVAGGEIRHARCLPACSTTEVSSAPAAPSAPDGRLLRLACPSLLLVPCAGSARDRSLCYNQAAPPPPKGRLSMKHTISALVENRPGVLARSASLFARRGFNIDSLAVAETENPEVSRMILTVTGDDRVLEQICRQLEKLVDVIKVLDHTQDLIVERELCLIKVKVNRKNRAEVIQVANIFRGEIVDVGNGAVIIEITGDTSKIDAFSQLMTDYGIEELVRTGKVVLARGHQPT